MCRRESKQVKDLTQVNLHPDFFSTPHTTSKLRRHSELIINTSYADTVKLVEDNFFRWGLYMRMKHSRKGLQAHIIKPTSDTLSPRGAAAWTTGDLKALDVIAGDVVLTYQVYVRGN